MEILAREGKQPVVDNNQPIFEWLPGKYIEDFQHDLIIQKEEGPYENQVNENEIEQQQERDQEEENYITDIETMGDKEEEVNVSERNEIVEDIMNHLCHILYLTFGCLFLQNDS